MSETKKKRASATLLFMLRAIFGLPGLVADYTVGTVIVLVQLAISAYTESRSHELRTES